MTADFAAWHDEHRLDHRRRLRTAMCVSLAIHGLMFVLFAAAPPAPVVELPHYVAVDLVAAPPSRPARGKAPPSASPKPPPPAAEPAPPAPPPPPVAKAPVQVLPEETPGRIRKAKPEPELSKAKPEPKQEPKPAPRRRRRAEPEEQVSLEDLLAAEGPDEATSMLRREEEGADPDAQSAGTPGPGVQVSPEQLAWDRAVISRISSRFVDLARYRGRGLVVRFRIRVGPTGELNGDPVLLSTSGDVAFDDSALSAVLIAGPFPPPITPEPRTLSLRPEAAAR